MCSTAVSACNIIFVFRAGSVTMVATTTETFLFDSPAFAETMPKILTTETLGYIRVFMVINHGEFLEETFKPICQQLVSLFFGAKRYHNGRRLFLFTFQVEAENIFWVEIVVKQTVFDFLFSNRDRQAKNQDSLVD